MTGKLLRVEDRPVRLRAMEPAYPAYPTWRFVIQTSGGSEKSVCSGRPDLRDHARELIGKQVEIFQGGKEGIVGGIREVMAEAET